MTDCKHLYYSIEDCNEQLKEWEIDEKYYLGSQTKNRIDKIAVWTSAQQFFANSVF